jgi:hypothetical protein
MAIRQRRSPWNDSWTDEWITEETRAAYATKRAGDPKKQSFFERLAKGHGRSLRKRRTLDLRLRLRLVEIEKIIRARHGDEGVPETDDGDLYIRAVAFSLNALAQVNNSEFDRLLTGWCRRFAPWALPRAGEILRPIMNDLVRRVHDLHSDKVAQLLCLSMVERDKLGIKTIGASDMTAVERKRFVHSRKLLRDRARQERIRRRQGRKSRKALKGKTTNDLKPWVAEDISRATWYRRRRRETQVSRIDIDTTGDTRVSPTVQAVSPDAPPEPLRLSGPLPVPRAVETLALDAASDVVAPTSEGERSSLRSQIDTDSASAGTEQRDADDALVAGKFATKGGDHAA